MNNSKIMAILASMMMLLTVFAVFPNNFHLEAYAWESPNELESYAMENWIKPIQTDYLDINSGSRYFGANRSGTTRKHAANDYVCDVGTPVYAMTGGYVEEFSGDFYGGTQAISVKNDDGSVARYCEISTGLRSGDRVEKGQIIGEVIANNIYGGHMLHLEMYLGTTSGSLTNTSNHDYWYVEYKNYCRRQDLIDPSFAQNLPNGSIITDEPIAPYPRPTGVVKSGSRGDSVKWVQHTLSFLGYDVGGIDGIFGNNTETAVYNFQNDYGLDADGKVDPITIAKIVEVVTEKLKPDDVPTGSELASGAGRTVPDGDYAIFSAINPNYYVDITGVESPASEGTNVSMYTIDSGTLPSSVDCWTVEYLNNGFYKIRQKGTNMCLDVNGLDLHRGTNIQVWTDNGTTAQQWSILQTDNGYKLQARCNSYFLDVNGGAFEQLTNVQVWESNESAAQLFCFVPYGSDIGQTVPDGEYCICLAKDDSYCLDAQGYSKEEYRLETNIQLWTTSDCNDTYNIKYAGDGYYTIAESKTGYVLDIHNPDSTQYLKAGRNVQLYSYNDTSRNQKWMIKQNADGSYKIISQFSGYCLDLTGGVAELRGNIEQYPDNGTDAQRWLLIPAVSEPQQCELIMSKKEAFIGERVSFIGSSDTADSFILHVMKNGSEWKTVDIINDQYDLIFAEPGNYSAYMTAVNRSGEIDSESESFTIKNTLRLHSNEKYELEYGVGYTYKSSNEDVVVVSKSGVVTAISEGNVTITVIDEEKNTYQLKTTVSDQSIRGDCNDDGLFDVSDVVLLQKWLLAVPDTQLANWKAADLCEDGKLDVFDLCLLKRKLING